MNSFRLGKHHLIAESSTLEARFDLTTGTLTSLNNRETGQELVAPSDLAPWRLLEQGSMPSAYPAAGPEMGFQYVEIEPGGLDVDVDATTATMKWTTSVSEISVSVRLSFSASGGLEMWPSVSVGNDTAPPAHFIFPNFKPADIGGDDRLLFPAHSGWLISNPLQTQSAGVYPDGYHGLSVQVMAYFTKGLGGFYLACHDPHTTHKELRFGADAVAVRHDSWDLRKEADVDLDYPVVVEALTTGSWFEAAEKYRSWALTAPWAERGPNSQRVESDRPKWLFEEVGLSIWGTPSSLDWSGRYQHLGNVMGMPIHVVSGWDWPATRPHYVGREGWFPARFHEANLESWADHYVTPYMNDLFISAHAPDFYENWEPNLIFPYKTFSFTVFSERSPAFVQGLGSAGDVRVTTDIDFYMCPATTAQRDLHTWRDQRLVGDYGLDGVFYDISSGNPGMARCLRSDHGHTPGWSRELLRAYADNNAASRTAIREATGTTPAQGVETIVEHVIGDIDFYVSRSVAGPIGGLEAFTLGPESPPGGGRELVPLFQAVYHDVGPVHEDGWVTFEHTFGDIFYWITARLVLAWGGILSLHYANNPPEHFEGMESAEVISWDGGLHQFEDLEPPDDDFIDFAREMGRLRVGAGNPFLAYGRMLAPVELEVPHIDLHYHRKNAVLTGIIREGDWRAPSVVSGSWESADGRVGLFLVNISPNPLSLVSETEPEWPIQNATAVVSGADGACSLAEGRLSLDLQLPSRRPVMVELIPE